ncbi:hypothetical protein ACO1PF_05355 [Alkalibacterium sp. f15]|uniref:hypothetical protein n=1 Tax=Alkalibacterium sp. f15 TaxID=3414029 RepID=UPI003BF8F2FA
MENLSMIILIISIISVVYFWRKDKKKRNISALIALFSFIVFGVVTDGADDTEENTVIENETEEQAVTDEYNYEIAEEELTELGSFNRLELRVTTSDQLDKSQIEQLLNELESEVENEYDDYDLEQDQLYIFLYENEIITDNMYSLGRLMRTEADTEIDARQKDWEKQPSEHEYELYVKFMDKAMELEEKAIEEDSDSFAEDDEIIEAVALDEDVDEDTISESIQKVNEFIMMNIE